MPFARRHRVHRKKLPNNLPAGHYVATPPLVSYLLLLRVQIMRLGKQWMVKAQAVLIGDMSPCLARKCRLIVFPADKDRQKMFFCSRVRWRRRWGCQEQSFAAQLVLCSVPGPYANTSLLARTPRNFTPACRLAGLLIKQTNNLQSSSFARLRHDVDGTWIMAIIISSVNECSSCVNGKRFSFQSVAPFLINCS